MSKKSNRQAGTAAQPPHDDWQPVHLGNYSRSVQNWSSWFSAADELQYAAELLRPQVDAWWKALEVWRPNTNGRRIFPSNGCHSISMMLLAFACENLCKGAMIRDRSVDVSTEQLSTLGVPKEIKTHKLVDLTRRVEFTTTVEDRELLLRMTRASVWRARYPAATKYHDTIHTLDLDGTKHSAAWHGEADMRRIDELLARLREHLTVPRNMSSARDAMP